MPTFESWRPSALSRSVGARTLAHISTLVQWECELYSLSDWKVRTIFTWFNTPAVSGLKLTWRSSLGFTDTHLGALKLPWRSSLCLTRASVTWNYPDIVGPWGISNFKLWKFCELPQCLLEPVSLPCADCKREVLKVPWHHKSFNRKKSATTNCMFCTDAEDLILFLVSPHCLVLAILPWQPFPWIWAASPSIGAHVLSLLAISLLLISFPKSIADYEAFFTSRASM